MQCYSELLPPSTVTHAVTLCLINEGVQTLVLAKTSLLQVFELRQASGHKTHLSLIGEYELSGTVIALQKIRTKDSINDSLLIACRDAKISLVQWDHVNHRIATISIHYYESEPVPRQPCDTGATFARSILTVDPASRCVALKFGLRQLAILPFKQQGEDLQELDEDMDEARPEKLSADGGEVETPYKKSLVLSLPSLDEELTDVVDIAFLHNYREPTFGIISTKNQASMGLYSEDQHAFRYQILALDLEQAASTVLATVEDLPIGLWKVVPMPLPVGGALLIGTNEVLHVAQSGKTHAVIINEFASLSTKFSTSEQVSLNYKLEDCVVELLDNESNDVLFVLRDGSLAVLHLTLLGPDVKSMKFKSIPADAGGNTVQGLPSCAAAIGSEHVFLGSDESDSHLMRWQHVSLARKRSHADMLDEEDQVNDASEDDANDDDMEDDDLYSNATRKTRSNAKQSSSSSQTMAYHFEALDVLPSVGPIESVCFGKSTVNESPNVEMIAVTGRQRGSRLTKLSRGIQPVSKRSRRIDGARSVWSLRAVKPKNKKAAPSRGADNLLFVSDGSSTSPYKVDSDDSEPEELTGTEFEHDGQTLDIGTLGQGRWIAHCRQAEIRIYEPDLSLSQIIPMVDEGTDAELSIVSTSFADPYLMVLRNDSSMQVLKYDSKSHDVEPLDTPQAVAQRKFVSGNLYKSEAHHGIISAIMLSAEGSLDIYSLPQLELIYTLQNAAYTPAILAPDAPTRRTGQKDTLTEVLMVDLGPQHMRKPYLLLRNAVDELAFYEPFYNTKPKVKKWTEGMRFRKVPVPHVPKYEEETEDDSKQAQQMRPLEIGTHAAVSIPGKLQHLILCTPQSRPKVLPVRFEKASALVARGQFEEIKEGRPLSLAVLTDNGSLHECDIPDTISWSSGWTTQPLQFELDLIGDIRGVTFHEQSGMYVVSTCRVADFLFATDDTRHPEQDGKSQHPCSSYSIASRAYTSASIPSGSTSIVDARSRFGMVRQVARWKFYIPRVLGSWLQHCINIWLTSWQKSPRDHKFSSIPYTSTPPKPTESLAVTNSSRANWSRLWKSSQWMSLNTHMKSSQ